MPGTIDEVVESFRAILNSGKVHGVVFTLGQPIKVYRGVAQEEVNDISNLDIVLSNVDIFEYIVDDSHSPADRVIGMCKVLAKDRLNPVCFVTGPNISNMLDRWFQIEETGLPRGLDSLIGLPILRLDSLSERTLLLCGAEDPFADIEDIIIVIKTDIDLKGKNNEQRAIGSSASSPDVTRVGDDTKECGQPVDEVGLTPADSGDAHWNPPGFFGKRPEDGSGVH